MEDDTLRLFADAEIEILPPETLSADPAKPPCACCGRPASIEEDCSAFARSAYRRDWLGMSFTPPHDLFGAGESWSLSCDDLIHPRLEPGMARMRFTPPTCVGTLVE